MQQRAVKQTFKSTLYLPVKLHNKANIFHSRAEQKFVFNRFHSDFISFRSTEETVNRCYSSPRPKTMETHTEASEGSG